MSGAELAIVAETSLELPLGLMEEYQRSERIFLLEVNISVLSQGLSNQHLSPLLSSLCRATGIHYNSLVRNKIFQRRLCIYLLVAPNFDVALGLLCLPSEEGKNRQRWAYCRI